MNQKSDLVLCSMAWDAGDKPPAQKLKSYYMSSVLSLGNEGSEAVTDLSPKEADNDELDEETALAALELQCDSIQYWTARMGPYYNVNRQASQETIIAIANRIGTERGSCS